MKEYELYKLIYRKCRRLLNRIKKNPDISDYSYVDYIAKDIIESLKKEG